MNLVLENGAEPSLAQAARALSHRGRHQSCQRHPDISGSEPDAV